MQAENESLQNEVQSLKDNIQERIKEKHNDRKTFDAIQEKLKLDHERQFQLAITEIDKFSKNIDNIVKEKSNLSQELASLSSKYDRVKHEKYDLEDEVDRLKSELQSYRHRNNCKYYRR